MKKMKLKSVVVMTITLIVLTMVLQGGCGSNGNGGNLSHDDSAKIAKNYTKSHANGYVLKHKHRDSSQLIHLDSSLPIPCVSIYSCEQRYYDMHKRDTGYTDAVAYEAGSLMEWLEGWYHNGGADTFKVELGVTTPQFLVDLHNANIDTTGIKKDRMTTFIVPYQGGRRLTDNSGADCFDLGQIHP